MSSTEIQAANQRSGGFQIDYFAKKQTPRPRTTPELLEHIEGWICERRSAIKHVRDNGQRAESGRLERLSLEMVERWFVTKVGKSPLAWMERSLTSTAMLLDYRSRQFGRRVHAELNREGCELESRLEGFAEFWEGFQRFSPAECHQALLSVVFSGEWQRYLGTLLIHPPGNPPPATENFPSCYTQPNAEVKRIIAELAHCRPSGAFVEHFGPDSWTEAGGREVCRKPLHCPHCHARHAARLVERIQEGPWAETRRTGRHLVFVRMAISTGELRLSASDEDHDRYDLGFENWLRTSFEEYPAGPGDETMIRNIDCNQAMENTLTTIEVQTADLRLKHLVDRCKQAGVEGGIFFHTIGPKQRNFQHELSVVGEVTDANVGQFAAEFGMQAVQPLLNGIPIECIIFSSGHADAARLAIAGSSWGFDLAQVGAQVNRLADDRCHNRRGEPKGLRGALAWQPLFLFSSVSFWSRWRVLNAMKFKSYRTFGHWRSLLMSDRHHRSTVQWKRHELKTGGLESLKRGESYDPVIRLRRRIVNAKVSQKKIAKHAGVSDAAVSRFVTEMHGSAELRDKLSRALAKLEPYGHEKTRTMKVRFPDAQSVEVWLQEVGRNRRWLALQLDWNPSKVSRLLNGKTRWNPDFSRLIERLEARIASH